MTAIKVTWISNFYEKKIKKINLEDKKRDTKEHDDKLKDQIRWKIN